MLGSLSEADDAVQEAWVRLSRSSQQDIGNLGGWLTTVVARVCLDVLRSRQSRHEESLDTQLAEPPAIREAGADPEREAVLADSVGLALLVVLNRLSPAERLAFVLHDMFAMSFDEIATVVGRSPAAARQLASRARRRVQGTASVSRSELDQQGAVVKAFLAALRNGDFEGLLAVLDPDVVVRLDEAAARAGAPREVRGARNWAAGAVAFSRMATFVRPALIDGAVGLVWAPRGRLLRVLAVKIAGGRITEVEIIADRERLREMEVGVLEQ
jgi:RNA polymerase sigma-70 factor (ECF subfamily)